MFSFGFFVFFVGVLMLIIEPIPTRNEAKFMGLLVLVGLVLMSFSFAIWLWRVMP